MYAGVTVAGGVPMTDRLAGGPVGMYGRGISNTMMALKELLVHSLSLSSTVILISVSLASTQIQRTGKLESSAKCGLGYAETG